MLHVYPCMIFWIPRSPQILTWILPYERWETSWKGGGIIWGAKKRGRGLLDIQTWLDVTPSNFFWGSNYLQICHTESHPILFSKIQTWLAGRCLKIPPSLCMILPLWWLSMANLWWISMKKSQFHEIPVEMPVNPTQPSRKIPQKSQSIPQNASRNASNFPLHLIIEIHSMPLNPHVSSFFYRYITRSPKRNSMAFSHHRLSAVGSPSHFEEDHAHLK